MELLQVFDDDKNMLDEYVERDKKKELPKGKNFMIILLFIQNEEGKFLIQKVVQAKGGEYATTGGHATFGDNNVTTAIKECEEELGIKLDTAELELVNSVKVKCCHVETFYCKREINVNELNLQTDEVESVSWLSADEINNMIQNNQFRKGNIFAFNDVLSYLKQKRFKNYRNTVM